MLCNIKLLGVLRKKGEKKDKFCRTIHYEPQEFLYLKKKKEKSVLFSWSFTKLIFPPLLLVMQIICLRNFCPLESVLGNTI